MRAAPDSARPNPKPVLPRAAGLLADLRTVLLVRLPDGKIIEAAGSGDAREHETLARSLAGCFAASPPGTDESLIEFSLLLDDRFVVLQRGRSRPELALIGVSPRPIGLHLVLAATRAAMVAIEDSVKSEAIDV